MSLQRQLLLLTFLAIVFAGLLAFRVVPEVAGWTRGPEAEPEVLEAGPKVLVIEWSPPRTALEGSYRARVARRPDAPELEEVSDGG